MSMGDSAPMSPGGQAIEQGMPHRMAPLSIVEPWVTPFGDASFLSCGQFNQQEGVATFRDGQPYLLKDRGYAAELVAPLCLVA